MKYILSHHRLTRSANPLAQRITELTGERILVKIDPNRDDTCIIRYGNSAINLGMAETKYNDPLLIRKAGNKKSLSDYLQEKEFPHVVFLRRNPEENEFPIVARDELNRGGGIGIRIIETMTAFENGDIMNYWTPWYNFKFELGVHILGGEIVRVFKKLREDGLEEEKYPIKNTQRGYKFSLRANWRERYTGLSAFVKKLYEIVPIQFARLDVGYDRETGGYRLIEINSAPDLSQNQNTLNLYAEFLVKKIFGV
jgi:hypothetical protein